MKFAFRLCLGVCIIANLATGSCAEVFARYQGVALNVITDEQKKPDWSRTVDAAIVPVLGNDMPVDEKAVEAEISEQVRLTKSGTDDKQFAGVIKQLNQIKLGLDYYKNEMAKSGSVPEVAMKNSWDYATSAGVAMGLNREQFESAVTNGAFSDKEYEAFVSMIPTSLDDAIEKSKDGWRKDATEKTKRDKFAADVTLNEMDVDVLTSGKLNNDPAYRHVQTTDTLLVLKKRYVLRRRTVERLLEKGVFATPALNNELATWWKTEKNNYLKEFPKWGDSTLATYRNTDIQRFNREKITAGSLQDRQINESSIFINKVVSIYLDGELEKASAQGNNYLSLDEFEVNHWREIEEGLNRTRSNLDVYKVILTSYTAATKTDPGLTSEEFYNSIPDDVRKNAALLRHDTWKRQLARWPTIESVDAYIASWPHTPREGFEAYGKKYAMANFAKHWAMEELKKLEPGLWISSVAVEKHLAESNSGNPKISAAQRERYESKIYNEVRIRMIINRELDKIEFQDEAFKTELLAYWENYQRGSTKGMENVLPWDKIK